MSEKQQETVPKTSVADSANNFMNRLSPVENSLLEYVLFVHGRDAEQRAHLISLLIHAQLLARGARLTAQPGDRQFAVPDQNSLNADPLRLSYILVPRPKAETLSTVASKLQLSVVETDSQIFVNLTDTTTDKFGHLEVSGLEHVRLDAVSHSSTQDVNTIFPQLDALLNLIDEQLWKPVLPSPPLNRLSEVERKRDKKDPAVVREETQRDPPIYFDVSRPTAQGFPFPDYGRSDLDPLGSLAGRGGMILDPRRPIPSGSFGPSGSFLGGPDVLPPGSVPPGARFDPFGPGIVPVRPRFGSSHRPREPDPDHALPPGYEDMYL
ncbi:hypothetical protein EG68_11674 [Paragonimus skrjabini miyazakii]|uniref:PI31 proteasome regulator C-terminal domain-containing protein n=1 Tax=Paragonimus skrjabini miyazakii TaxID=59628 RepID=A0A8S9YJ26_9TREM|nr:hypothetical protein EG68_11674 [Paragonimus skrjabini miyazakii]